MDPFSLLAIVAESMFLETSVTINKVLKVLSFMEHQVLLAAGGELAEQGFDFVGLHNVSKHVIYLKEGSHAAAALVKHLCEGHERIMERVSSPERLELMRSVQDLLLHKSTLLEGEGVQYRQSER
ncbi:MAG: hypothetical protein M1836_006435 [Candelina mexicana]|nr:MAG: hypothetical protein M1836_006435 [Candelina mexicana]